MSLSLLRKGDAQAAASSRDITAAECAGCPLAAAVLCRALRRMDRTGTTGPRLRSLPRDTVLASEIAAPRFAGVLRTGLLRLEHHAPDGGRNILTLIKAGDLIGEWPGHPRGQALEAATDAEICSFDPRLVGRLLGGDQAARLYVLRDLSAQHDRQLDHVWRRGALTSRERIIAFIVGAIRIMPTEHRADGSLVVTMTVGRRDWADMTNTTLETICRTLADLRRLDLVQQPAPGRYLIRDPEALMRMVGMDPVPGRQAPGGVECGPAGARAPGASRTNVTSLRPPVPG